MRLSYSKAWSTYECAKKGLAQHRRQLPPQSFDSQRRTLLGHVVDLIISKCFEFRWWTLNPHPSWIVAQAHAMIDWALVNVQPTALGPGDRQAMEDKLQGLSTLLQQLEDFKLVPTGDLRVQAKLERPYRDHVMSGEVDLLIEREGVASVDVKTGSYRKRQQLAWYNTLLEHYAIRPDRVGFWMPLTGVIEWKEQARLPNAFEIADVAIDRLSSKDETATPGGHCRLCPLLPTCTEGLQYKHSTEVADAQLALDTPGVRRVGFSRTI